MWRRPGADQAQIKRRPIEIHWCAPWHITIKWPPSPKHVSIYLDASPASVIEMSAMSRASGDHWITMDHAPCTWGNDLGMNSIIYWFMGFIRCCCLWECIVVKTWNCSSCCWRHSLYHFVFEVDGWLVLEFGFQLHILERASFNNWFQCFWKGSRHEPQSLGNLVEQTWFAGRLHAISALWVWQF